MSLGKLGLMIVLIGLVFLPSHAIAKIFTSKDGFSFDYPSNWELIDRQNRFTSISATLVNKNVSDNSSAILFEYSRKPAGVTVPTAPNYDKINYNRTYDEFTIDNLNTMMQNKLNTTEFENGTDKYIINNKTAPYIIGTFEKCDFFSDCDQYARMMILIRLDNSVIIGQYIAQWNDFDKYFGQVEKIFQSVKEVNE
jgi:hypothetical protein